MNKKQSHVRQILIDGADNEQVFCAIIDAFTDFTDGLAEIGADIEGDPKAEIVAEFFNDLCVECTSLLLGSEVLRALWTCPAFVPPPVLVYATFLSNATGLFQPSAEWRRLGL